MQNIEGLMQWAQEVFDVKCDDQSIMKGRVQVVKWSGGQMV